LTDDLGTPLGKKPPQRKWRLPAQTLPIVGGALALFAAVFVWVSVSGNSQSGEPYVVVGIDKPDANKTASTAAPATGKPTAAASQDTSSAPSGARTITIIDGKSGAQREVILKGADPATAAPQTNAKSAGAAPAVDARLVENSRYGPIPRVASDGTRPLDVYASAAAQAADRRIARIAIVVGGVVRDAILGRLGDRLDLDFTTDASPDENLDRLHWLLSRFTTYVGVTNYMGARFTAAQQAFSPILQDIGKRGLLYLDDGSSPRSVAAQSAQAAKAPFLKADLVVDAAPGWAEIDAALARLEALAADHGFAIGTATALPVSIERIARWAKAAQARGIRIVPLSAILPKAKQS
jgi:polysaccharide deacetylase 2 family uncharacterized protein YibQ